MVKIGSVELKNKIIIAPMAGISNSAFRTICFEMGAGLVVSEMISDKAICFKNSKTLDMTHMEKTEHPLAMQLFGHEVESMVKAAKYLDEHTDCDIIDINMGCPVPKVVNNQSGSYCMCEPEKSFEMVKAVVAAVKKPVTVKIRLGWDVDHINCVEFAQGLEACGVAAIAVHGRTRSQFYTGKADWEAIKRVKQAVSIPVFGNGDVTDYKEFEQRLLESGVDGIMIGRGMLGNPWLIQEILTRKKVRLTIQERFDMILEHARRLSLITDEYHVAREMRSQSCWYIKGLPDATHVKRLLVQIESRQELEDILKAYQKQLEEKGFTETW